MNHKQPLPAFRERLLQLIGHEAPYSWAARIGIAKATLHGLLRNATPTTSTLVKIARNTPVSLSWLLTGQGTPYLHPIPTTHGSNHLKPTEQTELLAPQSFDPPDPHALLIQWLTTALAIDPNRTHLLTVKGDAMEPTLRDGDQMLMDRTETTLQNDAIYLLEINEELVPKRLQRKLDGDILIKNDNPTYESETVSLEQSSQLKIIGRVIWIGRRI